MGGSPSPWPARKMHCAPLAAALLLCSLFLHPSQAFGGPGAYISRLLGEGYSEEKLPMTIVVPSVPDNSPRPAPSSAAVAAPAPAPTPTPAPAPATVPGSEDYMPTLPSEGRGPGAPSSGGSAGAPAPLDGASTAFISSNPAVPLPAGVTDSATVLPMPTPGQEQRQDVGAGTLLQARTAPLVLPLLMVVSFLAFLFG